MKKIVPDYEEIAFEYKVPVGLVRRIYKNTVGSYLNVYCQVLDNDLSTENMELARALAVALLKKVAPMRNQPDRVNATILAYSRLAMDLAVIDHDYRNN